MNGRSGNTVEVVEVMNTFVDFWFASQVKAKLSVEKFKQLCET